MAASADEHDVIYGLVAEWVSYPDDFSSVTFGLRPRSALPRRQAGHAGGRDLLAGGPEEGQLRYCPVLQGRGARREDRTQRGEVPLRGSGQPRAAADQWRADRAAQALLGKPRSLQDDAGHAARLRSLPDQGRRSRPLDHLRARRRLLGEGPAGQRRAVELRRDAHRLFPRAHRRVRGVQGGQIDYWPENSAKSWATDYDFPAVKRGLVKLDRLPTERAAPMQAFAFNLRRPQFQDMRVRAGVQSRLQFRGDERAAALFAVHRARRASSTTPS